MEDKIKPALAPRNLKNSDALSLIKKAKSILKGRKLVVLITDGFDVNLLAALKNSAKAEKAAFAIIAPKVGGAKDNAAKLHPADMSLSGAPSVFFDTVAILVNEAEAEKLLNEACAIDWLRDAFGHLKVIAHTSAAQPLLDKAGIEPDKGVIELINIKSVSQFIKTT